MSATMGRVKAKNIIKQKLDASNITRYQFWKDTGLAQNTAYKLYDDPYYYPGAPVVEKIYKAYKWMPQEYVTIFDSQVAS